MLGRYWPMIGCFLVGFGTNGFWTLLPTGTQSEIVMSFMLTEEVLLPFVPANVAPSRKVAERVYRALAGSPYLAMRYLTCECDQGVLVLRGKVNSYYLKQVAQSVARSVDGVEVIVNVIEVTVYSANDHVDCHAESAERHGS